MLNVNHKQDDQDELALQEIETESETVSTDETHQEENEETNEDTSLRPMMGFILYGGVASFLKDRFLFGAIHLYQQRTQLVVQGRMQKKISIPKSERRKRRQRQSPDYDPWKLPDLDKHHVPWARMTKRERVVHISWDYCVKTVLLLICFYLFVCSLSFLSLSFQLIGGKAASQILKETAVFNNPVTGLMTGILLTALIQSSSTTSSIVVSLVGSELLSIEEAIPIIMGTNVGTTLTCSIVALGQINKRSHFRRAFAGSAMHHIFNTLVAIILLLIEVISGYQYYLSGVIMGSLDMRNSNETIDFLNAITKPLTGVVIRVDTQLIHNLAAKKIPSNNVTTLMKMCCKLNETSTTDRQACTEKFYPEVHIELHPEARLALAISGLHLCTIHNLVDQAMVGLGQQHVSTHKPESAFF
ncbi:hypothetical protein ScPMuIL_005932 [Solemya velum]